VEILSYCFIQSRIETTVIEDDSEYEEKRVTGEISWDVYKTFFSYSLVSIIPILVFLSFILAQAVVTLSGYWLSYWLVSTTLSPIPKAF
jgi:hypothetical protein